MNKEFMKYAFISFNIGTFFNQDISWIYVLYTASSNNFSDTAKLLISKIVLFFSLHFEIAGLLISGADINEKLKNGFTVLHIAAIIPDLDCAKFIISHKINKKQKIILP